MIHKTVGIVLSALKYKEKSLIVKIYTAHFGTRSYIVNGVRQVKSTKVALYQPLTILDMVVYEKNTTSIQRVSEAKIHPASLASQYDIVRTTLKLFIAEVLSKLLNNENEPDEELFQYLRNSIHYLNRKPDAIENFHIIFLVKLCSFLGFDFDAKTGEVDVRENLKLVDKQLLTIQELVLLDDMCQHDFERVYKISSLIRGRLLNFLLQYYETHVNFFGKINSLEVLKEVFS